MDCVAGRQNNSIALANPFAPDPRPVRATEVPYQQARPAPLEAGVEAAHRLVLNYQIVRRLPARSHQPDPEGEGQANHGTFRYREPGRTDNSSALLQLRFLCRLLGDRGLATEPCGPTGALGSLARAPARLWLRVEPDISVAEV